MNVRALAQPGARLHHGGRDVPRCSRLCQHGPFPLAVAASYSRPHGSRAGWRRGRRGGALAVRASSWDGARGPDARRGGYDGVSFWARGGIADRLSTPGQPYVHQRPAFGDFIGGMCIAGGIVAALFNRERTGRGIEIDVSLLGVAMWVLSPDIVAALMYDNLLPSAGEMKVTPNPLVGNYRCADGKWLVLMMLQAERFWLHFAETIGRPDLLQRWPTAEARQMNRQEIADELGRIFA